jgi:hypothetical protein
MQLRTRFKLDHEATDGPGLTMQLVETLQKLREAGAGDSIGAEVAVWVCEPCDAAEAFFAYPERSPEQP